MNIISTLKTDHRNVDTLFTRFEHIEPADHDELAHVRDLIVEQLVVHAEVEEQTLYPALRAVSADDVFEALEEHHAVKAVLAELARMTPKAERFRAKMQVVIELVRHHVAEEEGENGLFAAARTHLALPDLEEMGERAERLRDLAPTRPHPFAPDQPPFNVLIGMPVAVLDRAVTTVKHIVERART
jgi:hypothetical protein